MIACFLFYEIIYLSVPNAYSKGVREPAFAIDKSLSVARLLRGLFLVSFVFFCLHFYELKIQFSYKCEYNFYTNNNKI